MESPEKGYFCRYCHEVYEDRQDVIVPCKCSGGLKYLCKECFNSYIEKDQTSTKYEYCPTCKFKYNRDGSRLTEKINGETRDEIMYFTALLFLFTLFMFYIAKFSSVFMFAMIVLYFYAIAVAAHYSPLSANTFFYLTIFLYMFIIFSPKKMSYFFYGLLLLLVFGSLEYKLISKIWNDINDLKIMNKNKLEGCRIFDFDLNRFVAGMF